MIKVLIGGDTNPMGNIQEHFINGSKDVILNDFCSVFHESDFSILNLECPLIKENTPIIKDGPILGADVNCINGIKKIGIDAVNLSNNHILDHGKEGLNTTVQTCLKNNISFFGAGKNAYEARKPLIKNIKDKVFCFIGIAEHEFSIATKNSHGANSVNIIDTITTLKEIRETVDYVIMLIHGGKEYYQYPTPKLQKLCRFFIDNGVDAIVCQHSHCTGTFEQYNNRPIIYGQGNFIFENLNKKPQSWYEGMLVSLIFKDDKIDAQFIPFMQSKGFLGIKKFNIKEEKYFLNELYERSKKMLSKGFIENEWTKKCLAEKYLYASRVRGHNRLLRFINKKIHFSDWFYSQNTKLTIRNVVECEVHREGLETLWRDEKIDF